MRGLTRVTGPLAAVIGAAFLALPAMAGDLASGSGTDDLFASLEAVPADELKANSGGTELEIEILGDLNAGDVGLNISSENAANIANTLDGTITTGNISGNSMSDVKGISSVFLNSGNFVNYNNTMQLNVFMK